MGDRLFIGLLIGDEITGVSATRSNVDDVKIIGDARLAALYKRAFAKRGVRSRVIDGDACATAGLQQLYESVRGQAAWT